MNNIITKECTEKQIYTQEWIKRNSNFYLPLIEKFVAQTTSDFENITEPLHWKVRTFQITYSDLSLITCDLYLFCTENMFSDFGPIHFSIRDAQSQELTKMKFSLKNGYAKYLVEAIYNQTTNLKSMGFFKLENYLLLTVIKR